MADAFSRLAADELVRSALRGFATADELAELSDNVPLRPALDLDSLDFLTFVERLSEATGRRIDEADYPRLNSIASTIEFLVADRHG
ncbi:acyl carrier protein [Nocardia cyriacigeorgica]|uniref:Acyl carrier protein n=1 Tax=Nocardia cyriacigeorgica TaxID=135487 RepID=A0A6P1CS46_9NOCA|nr:phosphopantetheine-binding protein [Nocardia cyriacigeorgica]NEW34086.1 acyl carrier protein [Nocardia cyriacigeorgica]